MSCGGLKAVTVMSPCGPSGPVRGPSPPELSRLVVRCVSPGRLGEPPPACLGEQSGRMARPRSKNPLDQELRAKKGGDFPLSGGKPPL